MQSLTFHGSSEFHPKHSVDTFVPPATHPGMSGEKIARIIGFVGMAKKISYRKKVSNFGHLSLNSQPRRTSMLAILEAALMSVSATVNMVPIVNTVE